MRSLNFCEGHKHVSLDRTISVPYQNGVKREGIPGCKLQDPS